MNKIIQRLLIFFIGLPLILFLVSFTYLNHIAINILITVFGIIAAYELIKMLEARHKPLFRRSIILILTGFLQYITYFAIIEELPLELIFWAFILEVLMLFGYECIMTKDFTHSL